MSNLPASDSFTYTAPPSKGMALASLILGILGCIPLVGIVAIILGAIAMKRATSEPQRFGGFGLALGGVICGFVFTLSSCLVFGAGVFLPALGQARQSARHLKSQSQLQQIGVALHMYATDNNGAFPESEQDWQARLVPRYVPNASIFEIPGHDAGNPATYVYIPGLVLNNVTSPASTPVIYESNPHPWKHRVHVLFADGHVDDIDADQLQSVLAPGGKPAAAKPAAPEPKPAGQ
jgi:prepilin-type processing-associated H-X9-DG protein